jgi:hypothetical protein
MRVGPGSALRLAGVTQGLRCKQILPIGVGLLDQLDFPGSKLEQRKTEEFTSVSHAAKLTGQIVSDLSRDSQKLRDFSVCQTSQHLLFHGQ